MRLYSAPLYNQHPSSYDCEVGIAPDDSQVGDLVCSFLESRVTLVIRPSIYDRMQFEDELVMVAGCSLIGHATIFNAALEFDYDSGIMT